MTCPFCAIVSNDAPATIVGSSDAAITIVPLNPVTEGHLLVIPRDHGVHLWDIHPLIVASVMVDVAEEARRASDAAGGCNIIQSNGASATQTVPHVHFHIVPRSADDCLHLPWTDQVVGKPWVELVTDVAVERTDYV